MTGKDIDPKSVLEPSFIEQAKFEANIDQYVDEAEGGQSFSLVRNGIVDCHLGPATA